MGPLRSQPDLHPPGKLMTSSPQSSFKSVLGDAECLRSFLRGIPLQAPENERRAEQGREFLEALIEYLVHFGGDAYLFRVRTKVNEQFHGSIPLLLAYVLQRNDPADLDFPSFHERGIDNDAR
jgi:hypothetical protein